MSRKERTTFTINGSSPEESTKEGIHLEEHVEGENRKTPYGDIPKSAKVP